MRHNLLGKVKEQAQMELELKAFIQQYMDRMLEDRLRWYAETSRRNIQMISR